MSPIRLGLIVGLMATLFSFVMGLGSYWIGYQKGAEHERTLYQKAAAEMLANQEQAIREELQQQIDIANGQVRELRDEKAAVEAKAKQLKERIDYVTTHYRPTPQADPEPLPACIFNNGFVGVYNGAIGASGVPGAGVAAGTDGETGSAGAATPDPLGISNVRQSDILHHITGYGSRCQAIELQLNSLIDYLNKTQEPK